jgi:hypothetical protein
MMFEFICRYWWLVLHVGYLHPRPPGVPHPAKVTRTHFIDKFYAASGTYHFGRHNPTRHTIDKSWSKMLGVKTWPTVSEETLRPRVAAWSWLEALAGGLTSPIEAALFSKLAPQGLLLKKGTAVFASLGSYDWAVLVVAVKAIELLDGTAAYVFNPEAEVQWLHLVCPSDWESFQFDEFRTFDGPPALAMRQIGPVEPLTKTVLRRRVKLLKDDLFRLVEHFKVVVSGAMTVDRMKRALAVHFSDGDDDFVQAVMKPNKEKIDVVDLLLQDPDFDEAFAELGDDDKQEFKDITKALAKRRVKTRMRDYKFRHKRLREGDPGGLGRTKRLRLIPGPAPRPPPPPPPPLPPSDVAPAMPPPPPHAVGDAVHRAPCPAEKTARSQHWGSHFQLAGAYPRGVEEMRAWTATCSLHPDGGRCNKSINVGAPPPRADIKNKNVLVRQHPIHSFTCSRSRRNRDLEVRNYLHYMTVPPKHLKQSWVRWSRWPHE